MSNSTETNLKLRFSSGDSELEADVLDELQSIMRLHSIDVDELWYKWESYIMKMGSTDMRLNIETARNLKKSIQDELEVESRSKAHQLQSNKRNPRASSSKNDVFQILDALVPNIPKVKKTNGKFDTPLILRTNSHVKSNPQVLESHSNSNDQFGQPGVTSINERPNAGQTIEILNEHLPKLEAPGAPFSEPRIKLTANSDMKKLSYKTMAMKLSEASEILDDKIDEYMLLIQDHYKLEDGDFGCAASQTVNEIIAIGRIATDVLDGKLNSASLVLETSRRMGAGLRIPLKVHNILTFQFFPGQIVALKGINSSGENFTVNEVLEPPLLPGAASTLATMRHHLQRLKGGSQNMDIDSDPKPLNIITGAGPYTADDNLKFEPLHALCCEAADSYADGLILIGPFVDIYHPMIANGDFDIPGENFVSDMPTMSILFKNFITPCLNRLISANPHMTIILVPSVRDALSQHVCWPQEPFSRKDLGLPKAVKIVGNPMIISLNEIAFGISAQDVLTELRISEVLSQTLKDNSMSARLAKYLIEQRNFFPVFPSINRDRMPKIGTSSGLPTGAMLDISYLKLGEIINVRPDILLVPSALPPFAKVVESVLVINPGYLSKRKATGTFAKISIQSASIDIEGDDSCLVSHKIYERARVEITRI